MRKNLPKKSRKIRVVGSIILKWTSENQTVRNGQDSPVSGLMSMADFCECGFHKSRGISCSPEQLLNFSMKTFNNGQ